MTDPPHKPQETPTPPPQHHHQQEQPKRLCDYCNDRTAILYCRADSAKLCFSCDREVHSTNQLFSKHSRSLLCDACDAAPASIFCETEHSVLCSNCDWENHGKSTLSFPPVHNRRSIESFTGRPSVNELFAVLGFDDFDNKALFLSDETSNDSNTNYFGDDGLSNLLVWEPPEFVSIDDLIVSSDSVHNYHAMGVPPLPKNRNAACGKHKEEMLLQLRQLARLKSDFNYENADVEPIIRFQSPASEHNLQPGTTLTGSGHHAEPISYPAYKCSGLQWYSEPLMLSRKHLDETSVVPDKHSDIGGCVKLVSDGDKGGSQQPISTEALPVFPRVSLHELNSQERDSAISRYKEKKKTRRYDKHIRYESRKVRAESRTRIKGRFAKIDQ